jgi:serine/threonine protein kinase
VLAAGVLHGPNLVPVADAGTDSGRPWVASRLVRGPSLAEIVAETGPLPSAAATWLALDVARALVALHAAGFAHQAIAPGNTLLEAGGTMLTDFAISRAALTAVPVSLADDMFLLGCVVFFAATGREPSRPGGLPARAAAGGDGLPGTPADPPRGR